MLAGCCSFSLAKYLLCPMLNAHSQRQRVFIYFGCLFPIEMALYCPMQSTINIPFALYVFIEKDILDSSNHFTVYFVHANATTMYRPSNCLSFCRIISNTHRYYVNGKCDYG